MLTFEPDIHTTEELKNVLEQITFQNTVLDFKWRFEYKQITVDDSKIGKRTGWLCWVTFERPDSLTGEIGRGRGRDEIIWANSSLSSVVKTAWLLVELMIRHELMEGFRFRGRRIFNPHNSVEDLAKLQEIHNNKLCRI